MVSSNVPDVVTPSTAERIGQGTAVEQSRAVAEVQAAVIVAQQVPRNVDTAVGEMTRSCKQMGLAERAFFSYARGDSTVTGASVHLARELARCWGNIQYGVQELRRDDEYRQSEMLAWAWDVQSNSRSSTTFIVPHKRDTKRGVRQLTDMRDVYENNANNGARRLREVIFSLLPPWFVEQAKQLCHETMAAGDGTPLAKRIEQAIESFGRNAGVSRDQLEGKVGRPYSRWTADDVARLQVVATSLARRETTVEEEFPAARVTAAEVGAAVDVSKYGDPNAVLLNGGAIETRGLEGGDDWPEAAQPGSGAVPDGA